MDDIVSVAIVDGLEQLEDVTAHCFGINPAHALFQDFEHALVHVLKHEVQYALAAGQSWATV